MKRLARRAGRGGHPILAVCTQMLVWAMFVCTGGVYALTPESPEVKASVDRAVRYLTSTAADERLGGRALVALAMIKSTVDPSNAKVQKTAEEVVAHAQQVKNDPGEKWDLITIYAVGLELILLCELDPERYGDSIGALHGYLLRLQKSAGGWGYKHLPTCDTSMSQYAVLSMWTAEQAGLSTNVGVWENVTSWFLRTQDPQGPFGYQGVDSGDTNKLVPQGGVRHSMAAGGLGSLYICADHLGLQRRKKKEETKAPSKLLQKEEKPQAQHRRLTSKIPSARINQALDLGDSWMYQNYKIEDVPYQFYYLYALERYESFKEAGSETPGQSLRWYTDGAQFLMANQKDNGSWSGDDPALGPACDTSFAVLFLVRSTRKSLKRAGRYGAGTLTGQRGIPEEGRLENGRFEPKPLAGPAEELLAVMEDPSSPQYLRAVAGFEDKVLAADETTIDKMTLRLRELAGSERPEARLAAVMALGRSRDLDNVPTLIYALSDPDLRVVGEARDSLRFISRKFDGFGYEPKPGDTAARRTAIEQWKNWFRSIRPDAQFD